MIRPTSRDVALEEPDEVLLQNIECLTNKAVIHLTASDLPPGSQE